MKKSIQHLLMALAALSLMVGVGLSEASADEGEGVIEVAQEGDGEKKEEGGGEEKKEEGGEEKKEETKAEEGGDSGLSEEEQDYVLVAGTVACFNTRFKGDDANRRVLYYLELEGMTLEEYEAQDKKFKGNENVAKGVTNEKAGCDSRVLPAPPADWKPGGMEEAPEKEEPKKPGWTYRKKKYKGTISGGGVSGGRVNFSISKNQKRASGNISGRHSGRSFTIGFSGSFNKKTGKISGRGSSGAKNSGNVNITLKKKTGSGRFTGKINGRNVNINFSVKVR